MLAVFNKSEKDKSKEPNFSECEAFLSVLSSLINSKCNVIKLVLVGLFFLWVWCLSSFPAYSASVFKENSTWEQPSKSFPWLMRNYKFHKAIKELSFEKEH